MGSKSAGQNSFYVMLFSKLARLITTIFTQTGAEFMPLRLALMILGGICGGMLGRFITRKLKNRQVEMIFISVLFCIIMVNVCNVVMFL